MVMEPVAAKTTALETAGVKPPHENRRRGTLQIRSMEPAPMKPAAASAMCTSISHAWLAKRSSEYHSSCGFAQKGTQPGLILSAA
jgi:hypothetical protein